MERINMKVRPVVKNLKRTTVSLIMALGLLNIWGCSAKDDVSFARQVMAGLVGGRYAVRSLIDWPSLKVSDKDVGAEYNNLANEEEKVDYQRAFIDGFKKGFRERHATFKTFHHWRLFGDKDPNIKVVAAGCADKAKVFFFGIKHTNKGMRLINITPLLISDEAKFEAFEKEQASGK